MRILAVENSKANLAVISATLKKLGHEVICALNKMQTLDLFEKEQPDLVILSIEMQPINGFDCAHNLRRINRDKWIPIIFLNTSMDEDRIAQEIDRSMDDYLTKPINEVTLKEKLRAMQRIAEVQNKLQDATRQLNILLTTDSLTGIGNRLQFDKDVQEKIRYANRYNIKFGLLFIDLDNFKSINDHLGHYIGDLLLQAVALRLKTNLRSSDYIARLGNDEFAVLLGQIDRIEDAKYLAQKIIDLLSNPYHLAEHDIQITCSIGIACYPNAGTTHETLMQHADIALYHAKECSQNTFQLYTESFRQKGKQQFHMEHALRSALINNELFMYYQPIYQLHPRKLMGMEALMRWKSPKFGLVLPEVFIPIAEERGLITSLGEWAINTACIQAAEWYHAGYNNLKLAVNISSRQLPSSVFLALIKKILKKTKMPSHLLELELTESSIVKSTHVIDKFIKKISDMQIGLSLDDFGTGYSSFAHLKNIPFSTLKIDRSFIIDIEKKNNDALILKAIISLGKTMNLNLIAEGIETEEQLKFLIQNECTHGQGFYLSKPLSAKEMGLFIKKECG